MFCVAALIAVAGPRIVRAGGRISPAGEGYHLLKKWSFGANCVRSSVKSADLVA